MRRRREPRSVRKLAYLAASGAALYGLTFLVSNPTLGQTAICDVGGSCAGVDLRLIVRGIGDLALWVTWIAATVAVVRFFRSRRSTSAIVVDE
jgi:hypothetical protein